MRGKPVVGVNRPEKTAASPCLCRSASRTRDDHGLCYLIAPAIEKNGRCIAHTQKVVRHALNVIASAQAGTPKRRWDAQTAPPWLTMTASRKNQWESAMNCAGAGSAARILRRHLP